MACFKASPAVRASEGWNNRRQQSANHVLSSSLRRGGVGRCRPEATLSTCIRGVRWDALKLAFDALEPLICGIEADVSGSGGKMGSLFFGRLGSRPVAPMDVGSSGLVTGHSHLSDLIPRSSTSSHGLSTSRRHI